MKIAIVHDWLVTYGGAERVLAQMLLCFPQAEVFAVIDGLAPKNRTFLNGKMVHTTVLQNLPGVFKHYRKLLPLMPWAMGRLNLSQYDVVISSSHAVAKGQINCTFVFATALCDTLGICKKPIYKKRIWTKASQAWLRVGF